MRLWSSAARLAVAGAHIEAAGTLEEALAGAAAGNAGWLLPVEPLLHVTAHPRYLGSRAHAHLQIVRPEQIQPSNGPVRFTG